MKKAIKHVFVVAILCSLMIGSSFSVLASTSYYTGTKTVSDNVRNYQVAGYVYYSNNTSTSIDVDKLRIYVKNNSEDTDIVDYKFVASNGDESNRQQFYYTLPDAVDYNESAYYERAWTGYDNTYLKNNSEGYSICMITAGVNLGWQGGVYVECRSSGFYSYAIY